MKCTKSGVSSSLFLIRKTSKLVETIQSMNYWKSEGPPLPIVGEWDTLVGEKVGSSVSSYSYYYLTSLANFAFVFISLSSKFIRGLRMKSVIKPRAKGFIYTDIAFSALVIQTTIRILN